MIEAAPILRRYIDRNTRWPAIRRVFAAKGWHGEPGPLPDPIPEAEEEP